MKIIKVKDKSEVVLEAKTLLYKYCNSKTVLFLSGGSTPKELYKILASEKKLKIGLSAIVDERFGPKMHEGSNEKMIKDSGLFKYFKVFNIPIQTILIGKDIESTAREYEEKIININKTYKQKIAILGIGEDGHTAGISSGFKNSNKFVVSIDNFPSEYKQRITLTFKALEKLDKLILLVLGKEKLEALTKMFKKGSIKDLPARFYMKKEISEKTILITDQDLVLE